jgi:hypothetical protein
MSTLKISGKNLAHFNLPTCCPRAHWYLLQINHRPPFNVFPGIFSTFDSMQKKFVRDHLDTKGTLPGWMKKFKDGKELANTPHTLKFLDTETDIMLTGIPDEVLAKKDGTLLLLDYKTARYSNGQDALFPVYTGQLNAYAWLLDKLGHGSVSSAGLVYFEPTEARTGKEDESFAVGFKATEVPVELDPKLTPKLLKAARKLADQSTPPECDGGCKDCDLLDTLFAVYEAGKSRSNPKTKYMDGQSALILEAQEQYKARCRMRDLLVRAAEGTDSPSGHSSVLAWDLS